MVRKASSSLIISIITLAAALAALLAVSLVSPLPSIDEKMIVSLWPIFAAFLVFLAQEALNPLFSCLALRSIGQVMSYRTQLLILLLSTSANSAVPFPAGIPIRTVLQKQLSQIPVAKSAGAMLIETLIGYGLVTACALVSGWLWFRAALDQQLRDWSGSLVVPVVIIGSLISLCAIGIALKRKRSLRTAVLEACVETFRARIAPLCSMVALVLATMLLALVRFDLILQAMGIETPYGPLLGALLISRLAGVISLVPMGLGIRDLSLVSMLVLLGVSGPHAVAAAAVDRIVMTIPYLVGGLLATHLLGKRVLESVLRPVTDGNQTGSSS